MKILIIRVSLNFAICNNWLLIAIKEKTRYPETNYKIFVSIKNDFIMYAILAVPLC